jgi:hypothetical protein
MHTLKLKHFRYLAQLFSQRNMFSIAAGDFFKANLEGLSWSGFRIKKRHSISSFFEDLYDLLSQNYRFEYIYKNELTLEVLSEYHSVASSVLTEFRSANCVADALVLNGTSCVYEIKTELDNLDRLDRQITAYKQMFDHINVITFKSQAEKLEKSLDLSVGLVTLNSDLNLEILRPALSNKFQVDNNTIFDSLRVNEYMDIIKKQFGFAPDVPNTLRFQTAKDLFLSLPADVAHDEMVRVLKNRLPQIKVSTAAEIPPPLRSLYLSSKFTKQQNLDFLSNLKFCRP